MEALREEKQLRFCPWMHTQQEGRNFAVRGCEDECLRETKKSKNLCVRMNINGEDANCQS